MSRNQKRNHSEHQYRLQFEQFQARFGNSPALPLSLQDYQSGQQQLANKKTQREGEEK